VRFTTYHRHLLHESEPAVIYFPHQMQDELERMFLLMAILQTEIHREDVRVFFSLTLTTLTGRFSKTRTVRGPL
jgi:hypothetical protein